MLQAFEPPLDLSEDVDVCDDPHLENIPSNHDVSGETNFGFSQSTSSSQRMHTSKSDQSYWVEGSNAICNSTVGETTNKVSASLT